MIEGTKATRRLGLLALLVLVLGLAGLAAACGGDEEPAAEPAETSEPAETGEAPQGEPIIVGATLSLTGGLSVFGTLMEIGYKQAVDEVNAAGGLEVDGEMRPVELRILDNKTDPNLATEQAQKLYLQDGAVALLGPTTPPITIPVSAVAEQVQKPLVNGLTPIRAWLGAAPEGGWQYAWNFFFDEVAFTDQQFLVSDLVETNKKVALFTDTEEDGVVMGGMWTEKAPTFGYEIAYHAKFPVGTEQFNQFIDEAKASGAEILIAQMVPPDAVALFKQMKALGWVPKLAFIEKAGNNGGWGQALGDIAVGTLTLGFWTPNFGYPRAQEFVDMYQDQTGETEDLSTIVSAHTGAMILFDAIAAAGSVEPEALNAAIGQTDKLYPFGQIAFDETHASAIPTTHKQWRTPTSEVVVWPTDIEGVEEVVTPVTGLE